LSGRSANYSISCPSLPHPGYVRFHFDARKSNNLRRNPQRGIGFEEVQEIFFHPYYSDQRSDFPDQHRAIGWVGDRLYSVIFEIREDAEGESTTW
jgi:uncharacterized DUF497 family protein